MRLVVFLLALTWASPIYAFKEQNGLPMIGLKQDSTVVGDLYNINFPAADFTCATLSSGEIQCALNASISRFGAVIGDETPACTGTFASTLNMSCVTDWSPPQSTTCATTAAGECCMNTTTWSWHCGDGTISHIVDTPYGPAYGHASCGGM